MYVMQRTGTYNLSYPLKLSVVSGNLTSLLR